MWDYQFLYIIYRVSKLRDLDRSISPMNLVGIGSCLSIKNLHCKVSVSRYISPYGLILFKKKIIYN